MIDDRIDHCLDLAADEGPLFVIANDVDHSVIGQQEDGSSRQAGQEPIHHRDVAARRCRLDLFEPVLELLQGYAAHSSLSIGTRSIIPISQSRKIGIMRELKFNEMWGARNAYRTTGSAECRAAGQRCSP